MSTKRWEACPECGYNNLPTDDRIKHYELGHIKLWRYECGRCTKVWANDLQRKHNRSEVAKAYKFQNGGWYS